VSILPPKLDAGSTHPNALRQHIREVAERVGLALGPINTATFGQALTAPNVPLRFATLTTSNSTPTRATTDGGAAAATNIGPVVDNVDGQHAKAARIVVRAVRTSAGGGGAAGDASVWVLDDVMLSRSGGAATTQVAGGGTGIAPARSRGGGSTYLLDVTADTTNSGINITVTGAAATTIEWAVEVVSL
jgi:hypothetical protein